MPTRTSDLSALVAALKEKNALVGTMIEQHFMQTGLWMGRDVGRILPPAVTDGAGRVTLKGIGRERVVALRVDGPTITANELWGMTRAGEEMRVPLHDLGGGDVRFVGSKFDLIASPARPIRLALSSFTATRPSNRPSLRLASHTVPMPPLPIGSSSV